MPETNVNSQECEHGTSILTKKDGVDSKRNVSSIPIASIDAKRDGLRKTFLPTKNTGEARLNNQRQSLNKKGFLPSSEMLSVFVDTK
jgi:hypothetical protein